MSLFHLLQMLLFRKCIHFNGSGNVHVLLLVLLTIVVVLTSNVCGFASLYHSTPTFLTPVIRTKSIIHCNTIHPKVSFCIHQIRKISLLLLHGQSKDWDAILSSNDDTTIMNMDGIKLSLQDITPYDMRYNQKNCERCNQNFIAIQNAGGPGADIYCCSTKSSVSSNDEQEEGIFWFLGKVAHISDVTTIECIQRLWPMIQQHAANLRPLDLFGAVTNNELDIWYAPINTEFDVAYNRPTCIFTKVQLPTKDDMNILKVKIKTSHIGFQGEIYERGEEGFRTFRYINDGTPSRPEITGPKDIVNDDSIDSNDDNDDENDENDMLVPNDEQMEKIQKVLEGKDINAIYEEQERRRRNNEEQEQQQ